MNENTDRRCRRYIRISDENLWNKIDEIMTLSDYQKSFNKVINDALFYGLEELHKVLFEQIETLEKPPKLQSVRRIDGMNEEYFGQVVRLLKEVIVNETINKSILCSLFQSKHWELQGRAVSGEKFENGAFRDTPEYLADYELRALKELRK